MNSLLNKNTLNLINEKIIEVINNFFPGLMTLYIFFKPDLFSSSLTIYMLILILIFSVILTIPFHFCLPIGFTEIVKKFHFNNSIDYSVSDIIINEQLDNMYQVIWLNFLFFRLFLLYIAHCFFHFYKFDQIVFLGINIEIVNYFLALCLMYLVSTPLSYLYMYIVEWKLNKTKVFMQKTFPKKADSQNL